MLAVLALVFGGTILLVVATYRLINRRRLAEAEVVQDRLAPLAPVSAGPVRILKDTRASELGFLNRLLSGKPITARIARALERAGSSQTVGMLLLTCAVSGGLGWLVGSRFDAAAGFLLAVAGVAALFLVLRYKQAKRVTAFQAQLPEAIDMVVNAMKAGYSLQAAMKFVGDEVAAPLGPEFARFYDEQRLGVDVRVALGDLQTRIDSLDLRMFVTSLVLQRETGGNLAEILTNLSTLMRERVAVRGHIETLTAEPKLSALVLALLPVVLFLGFSILNPDYMSALRTSTAGRVMLIYGGISTAVGYAILRKMGNIDI